MRRWALALLAACLPAAHAAGPVPPWLAAVNEIRLLPDPFDARRIDAIAGVPHFKPPHCVQAATIRPGQYTCWAETADAGPVVKATLEYWTESAGSAATDGSLRLVVAARPCTTIAQAGQALQKALQPRMPPVDARTEKIGYFGARLFGHDMAPLILLATTDAKGCIVDAVLLRRLSDQ